MPFESEKFEAVVCVHALSHLSEQDRRVAASEMGRILRLDGYLFVEGFGDRDIRSGVGQEVEKSSFLRGNGILTHYYGEGEIQSLFDGMEVLYDAVAARRVAYGPAAGRRELRRVLMRKVGGHNPDQG
jgi:SAM-dependent methyltransferase